MENMELIIKQTIAKRNFDVEQFNKATSTNSNSSFLKPQETSIKKEKDVQNKNNEIKYIKIDNKEIENTSIQNNIVELPPIKKNPNDFTNKDMNKRISWGSNVINYMDDEIFLNENLNSDNILLKLKKIKTPEPELVAINEKQLTNEENFKMLNNKIDILTDMIKTIIDNLNPN